MSARCGSCGTDNPFAYPCHQQGCPHQHPLAQEPGLAPCPHCFESSGYVWEHGNDWESGPWSHQTNTPCSYCAGSGVVDEPRAIEDMTSDEVAF